MLYTYSAMQDDEKEIKRLKQNERMRKYYEKKREEKNKNPIILTAELIKKKDKQREKQKLYMRDYLQKRKINKTLYIKCDVCNGKYGVCGKQRHLLSLKHKYAIAQQEIQTLKNKQ